MSSRVQVIDQISGQVLFECSVEQIDQAYIRAHEYENMGIDIQVKAPGLTETLINSLGATAEELKDYKESLDDEINSHNDDFGDEFGCALCPPKTQI